MWKLLVALLLTASQAHALFNTLVVFGDSVSDNGNLFRFTNGAVPAEAKGYYSGRFSNGPVWPDYFVSTVGGAQQINYAFSGSTASPLSDDPATSPYGVALPSLGVQVSQYITQLPNLTGLPEKRLLVIESGNNDVVTVGQLLGNNDTEGAMRVVAGVAEAVWEAGKQLLASAGDAPVLVIGTIVPAQLTPGGSQYPQQDMLVTVARAINEGLTNTVANLQATFPNAKVLLWDVNGVLTAITANPAQFGFTTPVLTPCLVLGGGVLDPNSPVASTCSDPNTHLFYDQVHYTTPVHRLLSASLFDLVTPLAA